VLGRLWAGLRHSAALSAALSFVFPGLGQGWTGAVTRGALLAAPALIVVAGGIWLLGQARVRVAGLMLDPTVVAALLVLDAVLLLYRLAAIVDAYLVSRRVRPVASAARSRRIISVAVLAALLLATVSMHAAVGVMGYKVYVADSKFFNPAGPGGGAGEVPTAEPVASSIQTAGPSPTPVWTPMPIPPWKSDGRLNLLLVGGDAGPGRWSLRTDTMMLLSVDIATARAALFGIPRNLINVPLGPQSAKAFACACFPDLLNALYVYAGKHPESFPGGEARGYLALQAAVGALTGAPIDGMLVVDLNGFVRLVDALGGIDINVPYAIYDSHYPLENGSGDVPIYIKAGQQHMSGHVALEYARSRHQDDDYHRMQRQQSVLLALRRAVKPCNLVPKIPQLIDIAGDSLWTNLSPKDMPDLLALAQRVDASKVARFAFNPPTIPEYLTARAVGKVHAMVANAFVGATPSSGATATPVPTEPPDSGC